MCVFNQLGVNEEKWRRGQTEAGTKRDMEKKWRLGDKRKQESLGSSG